MANRLCENCGTYFDGSPRISECPACKKEKEAQKRRDSYAKQQEKAAREEQLRRRREELTLVRGLKELNPALKQQCIDYYERVISWGDKGEKI